MSAANVALVQGLYAAFGRNDIDNLVSQCAPDVVWQAKGPAGEYPMVGTWKGPEGVRDFFRLLFETQEPISFEPREFHLSGDLVFVLGHYEFAIKKNGRRPVADWVHVFKVENGNLTAFTEFTDTAQFVLAWRG